MGLPPASHRQKRKPCPLGVVLPESFSRRLYQGTPTLLLRPPDTHTGTAKFHAKTGKRARHDPGALLPGRVNTQTDRSGIHDLLGYKGSVQEP